MPAIVDSFIAFVVGLQHVCTTARIATAAAATHFTYCYSGCAAVSVITRATGEKARTTRVINSSLPSYEHSPAVGVFVALL